MTGYWNRIPIFRYIVALIAGIIVSLCCHTNSSYFAFAFYALLITFLLLQSIPLLSGSFSLQPLIGIVLHLTIFTGGICLTQINTPLYTENYFMQGADSSTVFHCRITRPPEITAHSVRIYIQVDAACNRHQTRPAIGRSIIYVKNDSSTAAAFHYGDEFYIRNIFVAPSDPLNPHEFNFKKYLFNQHIYHTAYASEESIWLTGKNSAKLVWSVIFTCKQQFINRMESTLHDPDALSVGEALVVGQKSNIDSTVQQAYANTGTMHILAVSGLHVGIVYILLEFLFKPFGIFTRKKSTAVLLKTIFILIIIWLYACLSGLSASVNRSAVMFTFLALGKTYERRIDTFNILMVSMIPLLLDDPYQITQVGFQLSYLAVGSILFFQPLVYNLFRPSNRIIKYIWSMSSVSIAAQFGTTPISIFYFHQFPNYFLLSNLIAIPVSFVVLVSGLAFFVLGAVPFLSGIIAWILEKSLIIMNHSVVAIDQLPGAVTNNLMLTKPEMMLWYGVVLTGGAFLVLKDRRYLFRGWVLVCMISLMVTFRKWQQQNNSAVTFYTIKDHSAILIHQGAKGYLLTDSDSLILSNDYKFHIRGDLLANGIHDPEIILLRDSVIRNRYPFYLRYPVLEAQGRSYLFYDRESVGTTLLDGRQPDCIVLTGSPYYKIPQSPFNPPFYIIDNANSRKSDRFWSRKMDEGGIGHHSLISDGAFITGE